VGIAHFGWEKADVRGSMLPPWRNYGALGRRGLHEALPLGRYSGEKVGVVVQTGVEDKPEHGSIDARNRELILLDFFQFPDLG
jgi:hypothetical protein